MSKAHRQCPGCRRKIYVAFSRECPFCGTETGSRRFSRDRTKIKGAIEDRVPAIWQYQIQAQCPSCNVMQYWQVYDLENRLTYDSRPCRNCRKVFAIDQLLPGAKSGKARQSYYSSPERSWDSTVWKWFSLILLLAIVIGLLVLCMKPV